MRNVTKKFHNFKLDNVSLEVPLISSLSRGMKKKLDITAAMSHHAKLLVLDEATTGLDPVVRDEILDMFIEYVKSQNSSIIFSSHIILDVEKAADIVVLIDGGVLFFKKRKSNYFNDTVFVNVKQLFL